MSLSAGKPDSPCKQEMNEEERREQEDNEEESSLHEKKYNIVKGITTVWRL